MLIRSDARNGGDSREAILTRRVGLVLDHMNAHPERPHTNHSLAEVASFSPYHFNRIFRRAIGIPPAQYLSALRIEKAKRLLLTTDVSVTDICYSVGYNSLGTFITRFTHLVGFSPNALRRAAGEFELTQLERGCSLQGRLRPRGTPGSAVSGRIDGQEGVSGAIFIGLFESVVPDAGPLDCQVLAAPGDFLLGPVADGTYHVAAVCVPWSGDPARILAPDLWRTASGPIRIVRGAGVHGLSLTLRAPAPWDPPILAALPLLLTRQLRAVSRGSGSGVGVMEVPLVENP
jgi:AraC family transcriptional regulator